MSIPASGPWHSSRGVAEEIPPLPFGGYVGHQSPPTIRRGKMREKLICAKADLDAAVDHYIHQHSKDLSESHKLELLDARLKVQRVLYQLDYVTTQRREPSGYQITRRS